MQKEPVNLFKTF